MNEKLSWFDRIMTAVTFAEANEHDAGKRFLAGYGLKSEGEQESKECGGLLTNDLQAAEARS